MNSGQRRSYDTSLRQRQADERRAVVIAAAVEVFSQRGFDATTIPAIAEVAAVSVPYLERMGTKADLFIAAIDTLTVGPERDAFERAVQDLLRRAVTMTAREIVADIARGTAEWNARSHRLWEAWAASSDPALQRAWRERMHGIRADWETFLSIFDARSLWRDDIPRAQQGASCWLFTMAETYGRMTQVAGLSRDEYVTWLEGALAAVLIRPHEA